MDLRTGAGEMCDLRADPHETHNLFDDPAAKSMRARLQEMINSRPDDMLPEQTPVGIA